MVKSTFVGSKIRWGWGGDRIIRGIEDFVVSFQQMSNFHELCDGIRQHLGVICGKIRYVVKRIFYGEK